MLKRVFKNLELRGLDMWRIGPKPIYKIYQIFKSAWTGTIGSFNFEKKLELGLKVFLKSENWATLVKIPRHKN